MSLTGQSALPCSSSLNQKKKVDLERLLEIPLAAPEQRAKEKREALSFFFLDSPSIREGQG